jgi:hypothetical protein
MASGVLLPDPSRTVHPDFNVSEDASGSYLGKELLRFREYRRSYWLEHTRCM